MKTIINDSTNPYFNLALEEYLLKNDICSDDLFYVWRNDKSVIIGRNQDPLLEVDMDYVRLNDIPIVRRISGGGTVFQDLGNINFTYITNNVSEHLNNYHYFLDPIIKILNNLGLKTYFVEKSHIYLEHKKISGNAQSYYKNKVIHHGTLLFDSELEILDLCLKPRYNDQNVIKSVMAKTTNIKGHLNLEATTLEFMEYILSNIFIDDYKKHILNIGEHDLREINALMKTKYQTGSWNYKK
ncbi:hypothetical protein CI105_07465 [Candidatus Izimaplasma bacterium ZiA1]|uniref:lipoate--protein ligase family protein n=1 Tax=Candidatus Izimoplasma sp. ZiA1 TaxID=2024899 RepID=UPI000BAA3999|nr:hypothetical protein CI105_07465 [Candidatus Izimaplasma bacterium ZiA1]